MEYEKLRIYLRACADCEVLNVFTAFNLNKIIYVHGKQSKQKPIGFGLNKEKNTFCIYSLDIKQYEETLIQEIPLGQVVSLKVDPEHLFITYSETQQVYRYNTEIYK